MCRLVEKNKSLSSFYVEALPQDINYRAAWWGGNAPSLGSRCDRFASPAETQCSDLDGMFVDLLSPSRQIHKYLY